MALSTHGAGEIDPHRYADRLRGAQDALRDTAATAFLIGVGADLRWLTGYAPYLLERLTMLVVPASGQATLVAPYLEKPGATSCPAVAAGYVKVETWDETDDPYPLVVRALNKEAAHGHDEVLVSDQLWAMFVLRLQAALPKADFELASKLLRAFRMVKDPGEQALLQEASAAADRAMASIANMHLVGRTEAAVSAEVKNKLAEEGHDGSTFAIVASGPHSAEPHHAAGNRVIMPGEPIVFDIGGVRLRRLSSRARHLGPLITESVLPPSARAG